VLENVLDAESTQPAAKRRKPHELEPISRENSATSRPDTSFKSRTISQSDTEVKIRKSSLAKAKSVKKPLLTTSIKGKTLPKAIPFLHLTELICLNVDKYDGEENMIRVFDAVRMNQPDFFVYLTHKYSKNSVKYNFYNVK
jgi:hypothetical protein